MYGSPNAEGLYEYARPGHAIVPGLVAKWRYDAATHTATYE